MIVKIIVLLFSFVQTGLTIRCYDCNSANNSMCLDPTLYDPETITRFMRVTDCGVGLQAPSEEFFCRKIKQTIFKKHFEPDVRVTRGCGWVRYPRNCYKADNEDHLETVCQCFGDLCNRSTTCSIITPAVLVAGLCLKMLLQNN